MGFKPFYVLTACVLLGLALLLKQSLDSQNVAIDKMQASEIKAASQAMMQCRVDAVRECETPRFLPPPFIFSDMSPRMMMSQSSLFSSEPDELDLLMDSLLQSFVSPTLFMPPMPPSWLMISVKEPCLGDDRDDPVVEELPAESQPIEADETPNQLLRAPDAAALTGRRRLTEDNNVPYLPSPCLQKAFEEQRVSLSCAAALHQLAAVRKLQQQTLVDSYQTSQQDMQRQLAAYSVLLFILILGVLRQRRRKKALKGKKPDGPTKTLYANLALGASCLLMVAALLICLEPVAVAAFLLPMLAWACMLISDDNSSSTEEEEDAYMLMDDRQKSACDCCGKGCCCCGGNCCCCGQNCCCCGQNCCCCGEGGCGADSGCCCCGEGCCCCNKDEAPKVRQADMAIYEGVRIQVV